VSRQGLTRQSRRTPKGVRAYGAPFPSVAAHFYVMPQERPLRVDRLLLGACALTIAWACVAQPVPAPWRRDDATLISVCFDGIGKDAPASLRGTEITDISASNVTLELIGHTTTGRPQYQAQLSHPLRFRSLFFDLPGGGLARFDRPEKLENSIEGWVYSSAPLQCVNADKFALGPRVLNGATFPEAACPDVGPTVSYRVDNGPGYNVRRVLERQRGLSVLNGLRGCRELVYGK
jgi:hypothetical protein